MPQELSLNWQGDLSLLSLMLSLLLGVMLSLILSWHFRRFGSTLSNREEFSHIFPFILLTTILIISVVKSSLALSLGLVGALSIVRFRTPIKEPEELAYLFIAIAMGLGLGANRLVPTTVASLVILTVVAALRWKGKNNGNKNLYLSIDWEKTDNEDSKHYLERLNKVLLNHLTVSDLRRFNASQELIETTYFIKMSEADKLGKLVDELQKAFPSIVITFIDQNNMPSV